MNKPKLKSQTIYIDEKVYEKIKKLNYKKKQRLYQTINNLLITGLENEK